jgi:hypothetical protein
MVTVLADAGVPPTGRAEVAPANLEVLLPVWAALLPGMATPEETMTSTNNQDDKSGSDSSLVALLYDELLAYLLDNPGGGGQSCPRQPGGLAPCTGDAAAWHSEPRRDHDLCQQPR